jgi:hypothetical protein
MKRSGSAGLVGQWPGRVIAEATGRAILTSCPWISVDILFEKAKLRRLDITAANLWTDWLLSREYLTFMGLGTEQEE